MQTGRQAASLVVVLHVLYDRPLTDRQRSLLDRLSAFMAIYEFDGKDKRGWNYSIGN